MKKTELIRPDGSISKHRVIRGASHIKVTHKDGTVDEITDLPANFKAEQYDNEFLEDGVSRGRMWRISEDVLDFCRRLVEARKGDDLLPRSIALLNENGETVIKLVDIFIYMMHSATAKDILIGHEVSEEQEKRTDRVNQDT